MNRIVRGDAKGQVIPTKHEGYYEIRTLPVQAVVWPYFIFHQIIFVCIEFLPPKHSHENLEVRPNQVTKCKVKVTCPASSHLGAFISTP